MVQQLYQVTSIKKSRQEGVRIGWEAKSRVTTRESESRVWEQTLYVPQKGK